MDLAALGAWVAVPFQIFVADLLLGVDNALLIALACRSLNPDDRRWAVILGAGGAIAMRLILTILATSLLALPAVKLIGAATLFVIALNVLSDHRTGAVEPSVGQSAPGTRLWPAVATIMVADASMSLDNVVALAAIARGNFWLLGAGIALSIPALAYGGLILSSLLRSAPWLIAFGAALLGWLAGDMALSDPLIGNWVAVNAPWLATIAPALCAVFVFLFGRASPIGWSLRRPSRIVPRMRD